MLGGSGVRACVPYRRALVRHGNVGGGLHHPIVGSLVFFHSAIYHTLRMRQRFAGGMVLCAERGKLGELPLTVPSQRVGVFVLIASSNRRKVRCFKRSGSGFRRKRHMQIVSKGFGKTRKIVYQVEGGHHLIIAIRNMYTITASCVPRTFLRQVKRSWRGRRGGRVISVLRFVRFTFVIVIN